MDKDMKMALLETMISRMDLSKQMTEEERIV